MPIPTEILTEYMQQAMEQPLGLVLGVFNPKRFVEDTIIRVGPQFPSLTLCIPSLEDTVFIVHKSVELD